MSRPAQRKDGGMTAQDYASSNLATARVLAGTRRPWMTGFSNANMASTESLSHSPMTRLSPHLASVGLPSNNDGIDASPKRRKCASVDVSLPSAGLNCAQTRITNDTSDEDHTNRSDPMSSPSPCAITTSSSTAAQVRPEISYVDNVGANTQQEVSTHLHNPAGTAFRAPPLRSGESPCLPMDEVRISVSDGQQEATDDSWLAQLAEASRRTDVQAAPVVPVVHQLDPIANVTRLQSSPALMNEKMPHFASMLAQRIQFVSRRQPPSLDIIEMPRLELLRDACKAFDYDYLHLHQLYCIDFRYGNLQSFPNTFAYAAACKAGLINLDQLLASNRSLSADAIDWFCQYPEPISSIAYTAIPYQDVVVRTGTFLTTFAERWSAFRALYKSGQDPPTIRDMTSRLRATSPTLQLVIFRVLLRMVWIGQKAACPCYRSCERVFTKSQASLSSVPHSTRNAQRPSINDVSQEAQAEIQRLLRNHMEHTYLAMPNGSTNIACGRQTITNQALTGVYSRSERTQSVQESFGPILMSTPESTPSTSHVSPRGPPAPHMTGEPASMQASSVTLGPLSWGQYHGPLQVPTPQTADPNTQRSQNIVGSQANLPWTGIIDFSLPGTSHTDQDSNKRFSNTDPIRPDRLHSYLYNTPEGARQPGLSMPTSSGIPSATSTAASLALGTNRIAQPPQASNFLRNSTSMNATAQGLHTDSRAYGPEIILTSSPLVPQPYQNLSPVTYSSSSQIFEDDRFFSAPPPNSRWSLPAIANPTMTAMHQVCAGEPHYSFDQAKFSINLPRIYKYIEKVHDPVLVMERGSPYQCQTLKLQVSELAAIAHDSTPVLGIPTRKVSVGTQIFRIRSIKMAGQHIVTTPGMAVTADTCWPPSIAILLNGTALDVRRKSHHGKDLSIDVTRLVRQDDNQIESAVLSLDQNWRDRYLITMETIKIIDEQTIKQHLAVISPEHSCNKIHERFEVAAHVDPDIEIMQAHTVLDLTDPFTARIFTIPVRGRECLHHQCFDLDTFLHTRGTDDLTQPCEPEAFRCPICKGDAQPSTLVKDEFFASIRNELEAMGRLDVKAVILKEGQKWEIREEEDGDRMKTDGGDMKPDFTVRKDAGVAEVIDLSD